MRDARKVELAGWGGYPRVRSTVWKPVAASELETPFSETVIVRGQGRSYGDAALSRTGVVVLSEKLNRQLLLDDSGAVSAEAGTTIDQVIKRVVPQGWFPTVVPGTKFVSLGGCLAADVHGKNHHRVGSFAEHVLNFELLLANQEPLQCSVNENPEVFWATAGGMGLTGIITQLTLQLIPIESPYLIVQHHQSADLEKSMRSLSDPELDDEYSVVWLDCLARGRKLGRSVLIRGRHAKVDEVSRDSTTQKGRQFDLKFHLPSSILNPRVVATLNDIYYRYQGSRKHPFTQHYDDFFFPLDRIGNWPRMYGRRGFVQYQCVFPLSESEKGIQRLLEELSASGRASFLSVLKRFRPANQGLLSFPSAGYTLTLDFPMSQDLLPFLNRLDQIVLKSGGRVYLAKDARLSAETFKLMYPRLEEWCGIKARLDPRNSFQSDLSRRLEIMPAHTGARVQKNDT